MLVLFLIGNKENAKRRIATIPIGSTINKVELDERRVLLEHRYQMVEYVKYPHHEIE